MYRTRASIVFFWYTAYMNDLAKKLESLGLTEKEAAVYVAALELGASPAQKIAERAKVKRGTTYLAIESLTKRGLMSSVTKGKKVFFCGGRSGKFDAYCRAERSEYRGAKIVARRFGGTTRCTFSHTGKSTECPILRRYRRYRSDAATFFGSAIFQGVLDGKFRWAF